MAWKQMTRAEYSGGFGLRMYSKRLQLVYGTKAGLHIESEWEEGTRITVVIPDIIKHIQKGRECLIWKKARPVSLKEDTY